MDKRIENWAKRGLRDRILTEGPKNASSWDGLFINDEGEVCLAQAQGNATDVKKNRVIVIEQRDLPEETKRRLARDRSKVFNG